MTRIKVWTALIGLGAAALAGASWVSANQQSTPAPAPATAPVAAPVTAPAPPAASTAAAAQKPGAGQAGTRVAAKAPQKPLDKPLWTELNAGQQLALQPLAAEWDKLDTLRKHKWLEIANRYSSMKPDEQQRVHERMREWIKLTPEQRRVVRENYTRSKKIEPGQKSAQWEQYQQLPEEQKQKLAADAAAKKQLANLPSPSQSKAKTIAPIKSGVILPPPMPAAVAPAAVAPPAAPTPVPAPAGVVPAPGAAPASPPAPSNVK